MTPDEQAQLNRIEAKVDLVVGRVDKLEAKSTWWGFIGGLLPAIIAHLGGCF